MPFYKPGNSLSRFKEAFLELEQEMTENAATIERVLNDFFLDCEGSLLSDSLIKRNSTEKKPAGAIKMVRVSIEKRKSAIDPTCENGESGFAFKMWVDFENKPALYSYNTEVNAQLPVEFWDDSYRVENKVREILDKRDCRYSFRQLSALEKAWEELESYLMRKNESTLLFERVMVFLFLEGRIFD